LVRPVRKFPDEVPSHRFTAKLLAKYLLSLIALFPAPPATTVKKISEQGPGTNFQLSWIEQTPGWLGEKVALFVVGWAPPLMMSAAFLLIVYGELNALRKFPVLLAFTESRAGRLKLSGR